MFSKTKIKFCLALWIPLQGAKRIEQLQRTKPLFYHTIGSLKNSPNMFLTHFYLEYLFGLASKRQSISYVSRSNLSGHPHENLLYLRPCAHVGVSRCCLFVSFLKEGPIFFNEPTIRRWILFPYYKVMKSILRLELIKSTKRMP